MAIAEQFAGLKMDELIGGPLSAAADASTLLANSTADFINRIGFDQNGRVRTVPFSYHQRSVNDDGTSNYDEMKVDVPMLAIVPIPNLQIDEVNILFDMEVKQSEKSEKSLDMGASLSGSLNLGIVKVNVTGSVSAHSSNTRSSDNSAKYHVDVRATNHGTPEGLARVLDMMAYSISPALVSTTLKDQNGQDLSESAKQRANELKAKRQEISQLESKLSACKTALDANMKRLKDLGTQQNNTYQSVLLALLNDLPEKDEKGMTYSKTLDEINICWNRFKDQTQDIIKMLADSNKDEDKISSLFALKAVDETGNIVEYTEKEAHYNAIFVAQKNTLASQKKYDQAETDLTLAKSTYSDLIATR